MFANGIIRTKVIQYNELIYYSCLSLLCSSVADNKNFHTAGTEHDQPYLYCTLTQPGDKVS